ncbi:MAG: 2-oxo acid dehydrogenase subunit E2 [Oscillospiraceae bacterium]|nr:2-oxo acid dehydrogenase subunit E2 [Oscillospiraceae bacterium]
MLMPQLGISEESAILTAWHIKEGDTVKPGDKLFSIETGKSSFDVESETEGVVLRLFASEGDEVAVKTPVCAIGEAGEDAGDHPVRFAAIPPRRGIMDSSSSLSFPSGEGCSWRERGGTSPRAKHLAEKLGVDPAQATPTGAEGRVIERDIRKMEETPSDPSGHLPRRGRQHNPLTEGIIGGGEGVTVIQSAQTAYADKPLSHMRKTIAKNMMASLRNTAQLTHTASFDATDILKCRKRFKEDPERSGVTLGDMVLFAVTRVLPKFPALNAWLTNDSLRVFADVNLAVAVDTERGLMVPVVFGASVLTLPELSAQVKTLAEQCRSGSVDPGLLSGGSFTVSNLGQFGIESFTPILNAPQTGILGVCAIQQRVREAGTYPAMTLSLTYDHRAIDGAPASRFLQALCAYLEKFSEMAL